MRGYLTLSVLQNISNVSNFASLNRVISTHFSQGALFPYHIDFLSTFSDTDCLVLKVQDKEKALVFFRTGSEE